jgi:TolB protein
MKRRHILTLPLCLLILVLPWQAQAILEIRITQGVEGALPIAIAPFAWQGPAGAAVPADIAGIVAADLVRSGQFSATPESEFPQAAVMGKPIYYKAWRGREVDYLVVGRLVEQGPDRFLVQFQLLDTVQQRQVIGYSIPADRAALRRAAHQISDYIYEKLIGQRGAFNTRVAYVTTEKTPQGRQHALQIADSDGYNPRTMRRSALPLMSPAWSPDGRRIAYVSFEDQRPAVFVQDIATAQRQLISKRKGINGAPAWSPDGNRLALTLSESGNPEIYVYDLRSKALTRLTQNRSIDTEPVWMPDGRSILFTSDRSGSPQIYRVGAGGGRAERVTFQGDYNADAAVSPDGKKIAVVHGSQGVFRIAVLELESGLVRVLTRGRLDEAPSFAPNGSMIIYATEERGRGVLAAVSEDGRVHQTLILQEGEVREPNWAPFSD